MLLIIKRCNGAHVKLQLLVTVSIQQIKGVIFEQCGISEDQQHLFYMNQELHNSESIGFSIRPKKYQDRPLILHLIVVHRLDINLELGGTSIVQLKVADTCTVRQLMCFVSKLVLCSTVGTLAVSGRVLRPQETVAGLGLKNNVLTFGGWQKNTKQRGLMFQVPQIKTDMFMNWLNYTARSATKT